jgi:hypothetical protein
MVLFFWREFPAAAAGPQTFLVASDDGAQVWWSGKSVYRSVLARGMNTEFPDSFTVAANAGKNTILVKLQQGIGAWGIALWAADAEPYQREIRLRAALLAMFPNDPVEPRRDCAQRTAEAFAALGDHANAAHWWRRELHIIADKPGECLRRAGAIANRMGAAIPPKDLRGLVLPFLLDEGLKDDARAAFARVLGEETLEQRDYAGMLALLDEHRDLLARLLGREADYFRLRALVRRGDYEASYRLVTELEKLPKIAEDLNFRRLQGAVAGMRAGATQVKQDWEFDANLAAAAKLAGEDTPRQLARFLRNLLDAKADAVVDTGDGALFAGALPRYRQAFLPYREAYQRELAAHLRLLAETSSPRTPASSSRPRASSSSRTAPPTRAA